MQIDSLPGLRFDQDKDFIAPTSLKYKKLCEWRTHISAKGTLSLDEVSTRRTKGLFTQSVVIPDKARWITGMAASPTDNTLAVSSASQGKNLFMIKYDQDIQTGDKDAKSRVFTMTSSYTNPFPIFDIDWQGDQMLLGCANNYVQLLQVTPEGNAQPKAKYVHLMSQKHSLPTPPGRYVNTTRVNQVQFQHGSSSSASKLFLATETTNLRIWDVDRTEAPYASCKVSEDPTLTSQWSPLNPNLIAFGGVDKALAVIDVRIMGLGSDASMDSKDLVPPSPVVWFQYNAHSDTVNKVKWSPFMPYWLASAGEDSRVNIWDLRFSSTPVSCLDHSGNSVTALDWSTSHGDMISTGTGDGTWNLWSVKAHSYLYDSYSKKDTQSAEAFALGGAVVAECGQEVFASGVRSVVSSPQWLNAYFAVSSTGELAVNAVPGELIYDYGDKMFNDFRQPVESDLERLVKSRDMETAYESLIDWARDPENEENLEQAAVLTDICLPLATVDANFDFPQMETDFFAATGTTALSPTSASPVSRDPTSPQQDMRISWLTVYQSVTDPIDIVSGLYFTAKYRGAGLTNTVMNQVLDEKDRLTPFGDIHSKGKCQTVVPSHLMSFQHDVQLLAHHLPPGFNPLKSRFFKVPADVSCDFEHFQLRIRLLELMRALQNGHYYFNEFSESENKVSIASKLADEHASVIKALEEDISCLSSNFLRKLIETEIARDYIKGLEFGRRIVEIYDKHERNGSNEEKSSIRFRHCSSLVHLLLFPTVYDDEETYQINRHPGRESTKHSAPSSPTKSTFLSPNDAVSPQKSRANTPLSPASRLGRTISATESIDNLNAAETLLSEEAPVEVSRKPALDSLLKNPKMVLPMIKLEVRIQKTLHKFYSTKAAQTQADNNRGSRNALLKAVSNEVLQELSAGQKTISVSVNRAHLNALLLNYSFDQYLTVIVDLMMTYGQFDFGKSLMAHIERVGLQRLSRCLEEWQKKLDPALITALSLPVQFEGHDLNELLISLIRLMFLLVRYPMDASKSPEHMQTIQKIVSVISKPLMDSFAAITARYLQWATTMFEALAFAATQELPPRVDSQEESEKEKRYSLLTSKHSVIEEVSQLKKRVHEILSFYQSKTASTMNLTQQVTETEQHQQARIKAKEGYTPTFVISEVTAFDEKLGKWLDKRSK